MEKLETRTYTREETTHHFYCDGCNKYLGETHECDDGWYPDLGEFELKFFINGDWYEINKCFCDECEEKFLKKVENTLVELGFEKQ